MSTNEESDDLVDEELADMEEEDNWPESLRKPRRDSLSGKLELDGRRQLEIWLRDENRTYAEVRELLKQEFGVETSEAALCRYYERWITPSLVARKVGCVSRTWERFPSASLESAVMARARQMSYDEMMKREPDLRAVKRLIAMVDGMERRQLARERVALEQRRVKLKEECTPRPKTLRELVLQRKVFREACHRVDRGQPMDDIVAVALWGKEPEETPNAKIQAPEKIQTGRNGENGGKGAAAAGPEVEDPNGKIQVPGKQQGGTEGPRDQRTTGPKDQKTKEATEPGRTSNIERPTSNIEVNLPEAEAPNAGIQAPGKQQGGAE